MVQIKAQRNVLEGFYGGEALLAVKEKQHRVEQRGQGGKGGKTEKWTEKHREALLGLASRYP